MYKIQQIIDDLQDVAESHRDRGASPAEIVYALNQLAWTYYASFDHEVGGPRIRNANPPPDYKS